MSILNLAFWVCFFCPSLGLIQNNCNSSDLLALKEFAGNLTNGSSILSSWSDESNSSCCNWDGLECEEEDEEEEGRRVIKLNLSGKNLQGVVPKSLENLGHLRFLDLSHNHLEGGVPLDFSKLAQLEVLDLSHNSFNGQILGSLSKGLEKLHTINISSNSFTGSSIADLLQLPYLHVLNISNNSFSGSLISHISNVSTKIRTLDFSMNRFSGELPESLYSILSLERFSASENSLSGQLSPEISKLSQMKSLVLYGNGFSGGIPDVFGSLIGLEILVLHSNLFSGRLPPTLSLCSNLTTLDVRNNSLFGGIDLDFTGLPKLSFLDLASNNFLGPLPVSLSGCGALTVLSLSKNQLNGSVPESYKNLSSLVFLTLSKNRLENLSRALSVFQHCQSLAALILTKNFEGEEIPRNVTGFRNLIILALGNSRLRGEIPTWINNCQKLRALDLSWNRLDGDIPFWIGEMEDLFYMDLSNNSLSGGIPKSLMTLKSLMAPNGNYQFDFNITINGIPFIVKRNSSRSGLQYNRVSGFPPSIYLSNNRINGAIWPEIGRLKQLHVLDLSANNISGPIPDSISAMSNLEVLDLSHNQLHGSIPSSLEELTFLSKFSIAYNHLTGTIPTGGQFFSFPPSSFEGNSGLHANVTNVIPALPVSRKRLGERGVLGITLSLGVGTVVLLVLLLLRLHWRRDRDVEDDDRTEEITRLPSEASKLVLFRASGCKDLTVVDLLSSTNNFDESNIIGCGGFGLVYLANLPNGTKAAIKRLSGDCGEMEREFQAEVESLSRARHPNLVPLQGYCQHGNDRLLIYSYMANGSLDYWLHESVDGTTFLTWGTRLKIARGAARGLAYLHNPERNIIHRDIKTSNILLDETFEAHLADFGLSRLLQSPYDTHVTTDLVGTLGYIPPEYSHSMIATFRGDVYSFGVVLLELLTGKRPVEVCKGKSCRNLVSWVLHMRGEKREEEIFDTKIWEDDSNKDRENELSQALDIACLCVHQGPRERPTIDCVVSWLEAIGTDEHQKQRRL
ncbi:hypothetical protein DM860_000831 [Cuscuta australis]|uniref:non-specific serine/threonine protein kinase n=1 Tax=Cuscuta australis TaxID=267555 RepID=A0A328CXA2_9ASTE|nr:hypothetical protein DM860_000831 [Cuscuta australis]